MNDKTNSVKHTPGPWAFSFESVDPEWSIVTTPGCQIVANVNANLRQEANARLIAAAPDLLDACQAALGNMEMQEAMGDTPFDHVAFAARAKLQAAIKSATR